MSITVRHPTIRRTAVVLRFARNDDLTLIALPWLPLLSGATVFKGLGTAAFVLVCAMLLVAYRQRAGRPDTRAGAIAIVALLLIGLVVTREADAQTLVQIVQLLLIALAIRVGPVLRFTRRALSVCAASCVLLALAALVDLQTDSSLMFENTNGYGVAAMCWSAILVKLLVLPHARVRLFRLCAWLVLPIALAIVSESRASLAAVGAMILWPVLRAGLPGKKLRTLAALLVLALPMIAISLVVSGALTDAQDLLPVVGEKTPLSGRDVIWFDIISTLDSDGYRGFGLGSLPGGLLEGHYEGLSAHNGFLQILYQCGAVGLAAFLVACALVIVALSRRDDRGIGVAILLGALIHEMFEVVLTQNHFGSGLLLWLIVTMAPVASRHVARLGLHST